MTAAENWYEEVEKEAVKILLNIIVLIVGSAYSITLLALLYVPGILQKRQEKRNVLLAKDLEIGEGVTLLEGIRAYFGTDGSWRAWWCRVSIYVGEPEIIFVVIVEHVDGEADRLNPHVLDHDRRWASEEETKEVFGLLVEAARGRKAALEA